MNSHAEWVTITSDMTDVAPRSRQLSPFAELVLALRKRRGFSQKQVARLGGISPGYIGLIERGERGLRPSRDKVISIADGLRASDAERTALLRAAGHEGREAGDGTQAPSVIEAIVSDPRLRSDQREVLIAAYRSYVGGRP